MSKRSLLAAAIGIPLAGLVWWWSAGPTGLSTGIAATRIEGVGEHSRVKAPERRPDSEAQHGASGTLATPDRTPVETSLHGRVIASAAKGSAIVGALVTWTDMRESYLDEGVGWDLQDWAAIRDASLTTTSGADGTFELSPSLSGAPSVVWITARGFAARMVELGEGATARASLGDIVLGRADAIRVRVVRSKGEPVVGAVVEQLVPVPSGWAPRLHVPQAERVFCRQWTTDSDGEVRGVRFESPVLFRAWFRGRASAPWIGTPRDEVVLALLPTFSAGGQISVSSLLDLEGPLRIRCLVEKGGQEWPLATARANPGLDWGPVVLPLEEADGFRFRLERNKAQVVEVRIAPPQPGETVEIDFDAQPGHELWFLVVDRDDEPLLDARVAVTWDADGVPTTAVRHARESDGYVWFGNLPAGTVECRAECPGYEPLYGRGIMLPEAEPITHVLEPLPAGRVTGRVLADGVPLEDFELVTWPTGYFAYTAHRTAFRGRAEGRFTLDDVPLGDLSILATAPGFAPSSVVEVQSGQEEIVLEVEPLLRGRGRVVEARSGEPVEGAVIQLFSMHRHEAISSCGPVRTVCADGSFDLVGFAAGKSRVRVTASGYSTRWIQTFASPGEILDLGLIAMSARQTLTVELVCDGEFDPTSWQFSANGAEPLPRTRFTTDGILRIEDVSAGIYHFWLEDDNGAPGSEMFMTAICEPDADWHYSFPVGGHRTLVVEVAAGRGSGLPSGLVVEVNPRAAGAQSLSIKRGIDDDRRATFEGIPVGPFSAQVNSGLDAIAIKAGRIEEDDHETLIRIELGHDLQTIRVVDGQGGPLPGTWVGLLNSEQTIQGQGGFTDATGELSMVLSPGRYVGAATHPNVGQRFDIPIRIEGSTDEVIELVLTAEQHVTVKLLAGAVPAAGLPCRLYDLGGNNTMPLVTSDSLGLVRWNKFAEGDYLLRVNEPGYWPVDVRVPARGDEGATVVPVYLLGDLRVRVFSASGSALTGTEVDLSPSFLTSQVSDWVAEARVGSSTGNMRLDPSGALLLRGLPSGTYDWSVGQANGRVDVPAGDMGDLLVDSP
ncbi:MAG: hypothetical protein ACI8QZ_004030 [Chlamydiales bacterium]|jgi:hypothetical protein